MSVLRKFTVVLANLMSRSGRLNGESSERADLAIAIEATRPARNIILCGWDYRPDSDLSIAEALKLHIADRRPDLVHKAICQTVSRDTVGDAFFSRVLIERICKEPGTVVDVVTSDYHVARSAEIFRYVFPVSTSINVEGSRTSSLSALARNAGEAASLKAFRETFEGVTAGDLSAIHARLASSHPFYNGHVYPKIDTIESISRSIALGI